MKIVWQKRAVSDLYQVNEYIRQDNPQAAEKIGSIIESAITNLARYPEMGRKGDVPGTRELVIPGTAYFIAYRITNEAVQILRVLHSKQKWPYSL
jgi:toxin ParE1/3/4